MTLPSLFVLLVYVSGYMFLVFAAICLACGIYYFVELTEEYTSLTRRLIRYTIYGQFVVHFLLWSYERFPFMQCAVGFLAHVAYFLLLTTFPFINPLSAPFFASCCFFIVDNVSWFQFFHADVELFYSYRVAPGPAVASFFLLIVWLVPLAFFISLSVNDSVLPSANISRSHSRGSIGPSDGDSRKKSRNLVVVVWTTVADVARRSIQSVTGQSTSNDILSSAGRRNN